MSIGPLQLLTKSGQSTYQPLGGTPNVLAAPNLLTNGKLAPRVGFEPTASRLTAECSTILPGNSATSLFSLGFILLHQAISCHDPSVGKASALQQRLKRAGTAGHCTFKGYGAAFQYPVFDSSVHSVQLALFR